MEARAIFAKQLVAAVGGGDARLEAAIAAVPREDFLPPAPWLIYSGDGYVPAPDANPVHLYRDCVVAILPEQQINNGQPSLHTYLLAQAMPKEGEHIVHVGTGAGYYTAIMAELVGPGGRVTGIEFEPELAQKARANLARYPNVRIVQGDGAAAPFDAANVIYVNAGATQPAASWLDGLKDGGRLILPLTTDENFGKINVARMARTGCVFRIVRQGADYFAKWLLPVAIFPCAGNRDADASEKLARALASGRASEVTRLYRHSDVSAERTWLSGDDWCLAYA